MIKHLSIQDSIPDISALLQSVEEIRSRCTNLETEVVELKTENTILRKENKALRKENKQLKEKVQKLEHKASSVNSSMPPSSDISKPKRTQSLRKSSGKKLGGQIGHKGSTLKMTKTPDQIKDYYPSKCKHCGGDLSNTSALFLGRRQIVDIPPIHQIITEHRVYSKQCTCGACTKSEYPEGIKSPISYGSNIQSLVAYLSARQYLPINRIHELFSDVLNVNISEGGICYLLDKMAKKAMQEYKRIGSSVIQERVVGGDETGANINGYNHWYWTLQNHLYTYIAIHKRRGFSAITELFGNNFENTCLVTDCWPAYFKTNARNHQLCLAHLQRELIGLSQKYPKQTWTLKFNNLLNKAYKLYQKNTNIPLESSKKILQEFNTLLNIKPTDKSILAFYKRMIRYKEYLFNFLYDTSIPPDNNASERAIRNVKVKQKVSGLFKTFKGAENYAIFRTCIDTAIKQGIRPLAALNNIAATQPTE